jgi:hypothetical protein
MERRYLEESPADNAFYDARQRPYFLDTPSILARELPEGWQPYTPQYQQRYEWSRAGIEPLHTAAQLAVPARYVDPRLGEEELLNRVSSNPDLVRESRLYRPGMLLRSMVTPESFGDTLMRSPVGSFMQGVRTIPEGLAKQGIRAAENVGLTTPADTALVDAMVTAKQMEYAQAPRQTLQLPWIEEPVDPAYVAGSMTGFPLRAKGALSHMLRGGR